MTRSRSTGGFHRVLEYRSHATFSKVFIEGMLNFVYPLIAVYRSEVNASYLGIIFISALTTTFFVVDFQPELLQHSLDFVKMLTVIFEFVDVT